MRKILRTVRPLMGSRAIAALAVIGLPFLGLALILHPEVMGIFLGIVFLVAGLVGWSLACK